MTSPLYGFEFVTAQGEQRSMKLFEGKVLLIANTASQCGFTPQYAELEKLHQDYAGKGLVVIGFPCNQFGGQEPGSSQEALSFCQKNYGVTFILSEKVDVNGATAHPLFRYLTEAKAGLLGSEAIKWNFTKFLVNRDGEVVERYAPMTRPESFRQRIETLLE
jgi:glutathione peroxidase